MATSDQPLTVAGLVTLVQALDVASGSQLTHALRDALNELPHESSHIPDPMVPDLAANGSGLHALPSTSTAISSQAHAVPAPMDNVTAHVLSRILAAAGPRAHPAPAPAGNVVTQGLWVPNMTPTTTSMNPMPLATVGPQAHPAPAPAGNVVTQGPWVPT
ncbi:hypothetical protein BD779DRAFT_1685113 [Infundibulicybe gibba]|nr:hypothetical protein BD779DRAFT_1685113 [Infundibulicybe gibba]